MSEGQVEVEPSGMARPVLSAVQHLVEGERLAHEALHARFAPGNEARRALLASLAQTHVMAAQAMVFAALFVSDQREDTGGDTADWRALLADRQPAVPTRLDASGESDDEDSVPRYQFLVDADTKARVAGASPWGSVYVSIGRPTCELARGVLIELTSSASKAEQPVVARLLGWDVLPLDRFRLQLQPVTKRDPSKADWPKPLTVDREAWQLVAGGARYVDVPRSVPFKLERNATIAFIPENDDLAKPAVAAVLDWHDVDEQLIRLHIALVP